MHLITLAREGHPDADAKHECRLTWKILYIFSTSQEPCCSATKVIASEKLMKMNIVGCRRGKKVINWTYDGTVNSPNNGRFGARPIVRYSGDVGNYCCNHISRSLFQAPCKCRLHGPREYISRL